MSSLKTKLAGLGLVIGAGIGLSACDTGPSSDTASDLLSLVPADTPYVFISSKKLPEPLTKRILQATAQNLERRADLSPKDIDENLARLISAIQAEFSGKMTPEGLRSLGIEPNGRMLGYGLGLLPVIRIESNTPDKVEALLARIEKRSGMHAEQRKLGDITYRHFALDALSAVLAPYDGYLIAALLPASNEAELLPYVFGQRRPEHALGQERFAGFEKKHGFRGYGDGYIDLLHLFDLLQGETQGISSQVMQALNTLKPLPKLSPACASYYRGLLLSMPRMSIGLTQVGDRSHTTEMILDTPPGVASLLQKIPAPIPDLDPAGKALISARLGLNVPSLRDALNSLFQTILEKGRACESVDQAAITKAMQSLGLLLGPGVSGIKGMALAVNDIQVDPQTHQPTEIDADALLAADDPRGLFNLLALVNPQLASTQVPNDGTPVPLPLQDIAPMAPPIWVAIKDQALALAISNEKPSELIRILASKPSDNAPFLAIHYQFEKMMKIAGPALEQARGNKAEELREIYTSMKQSANLYDSGSFRIGADSRGLVVTAEAKFQ